MTCRCITLCRAVLLVGASALAQTVAQAADLPMNQPVYKAPPPLYSYFNWSGFYAGINAGYGFGTSNWTNAVGTTTGNFDVSGAVAGGTLGYNFQTGAIVWGVEGDFDWSGIKGTTTVLCPGGCQTQNSWLGTTRLRVGYAFDRWLPYVTAGAAFGDVKATSPAGTQTSVKVGWTAGLGVEWAFLQSWTAKIEYLYADLGSGTCSGACSPASPISVTFKTSLARVGVNYRF